jgi:hypothetical protein
VDSHPLSLAPRETGAKVESCKAACNLKCSLASNLSRTIMDGARGGRLPCAKVAMQTKRTGQSRTWFILGAVQFCYCRLPADDSVQFEIQGKLAFIYLQFSYLDQGG